MSQFTEKELALISSQNDKKADSIAQTQERLKKLLATITDNLPESYKQILLNFGYLRFGSFEIFGINDVYKEYGGIHEGKTFTVSVNECSVEKEFLSGQEAFKYDNKVIPVYGIGNGDYLAINLHRYNPETKEAPIWYLAHEELFDENFEEIKNPDYSLTVEEYEKKNWNFWRPTKYKDFKEMLMDAIDKKPSLETFKLLLSKS